MSETAGHPASATGITMTSANRQRLPGRRWWLVWLLLVAAALASRYPELPDRAVGNIILIASIFLIVVTWLVWFYRYGAYPLAARRGAVLLPGSLVVAAIAVFQVQSWQGSLMPNFAFRWSPDPDETLERIETPAQQIRPDLAATTPQDFRQFLGPNRDSIVRGVLLKKEWQSPPELIWKQRIGAGWSGFAAVNGFAVTLEQRGPWEILSCYEIATGEACWTQEEETRHESTLGYVGPRSTPTIHNGNVYALGATGRLRCVNGADGAVIWSHDLFAENGFDQEHAEQAVPWGRSASPLVVDQRVVVPVGGPPDGPYTSLIAFDAETGAEIWRGGKRQASYASPSLVTLDGVRQILCVNEDHLTGHDVDTGDELWEYPWPSRSNAQAATSQALALAGDRVFISKGYSKGAELLQVVQDSPAEWSAENIWATREMKTKFSNVAVHAGYAYGLDDGILECIRSGRRKTPMETGAVRLWADSLGRRCAAGISRRWPRHHGRRDAAEAPRTGRISGHRRTDLEHVMPLRRSPAGAKRGRGRVLPAAVAIAHALPSGLSRRGRQL